MDQPWIRASDADREHAVEVMRAEVGTGRLTVDEFSDRAGEAYRARTIGELEALTRDLPPPATARTGTAPVRTHLVPIPAFVLLAALLVGGVLLALTVAAATGPMGPMMGHMGSMWP